MKCWKCKNELLEESVFCSFCGAKQPMEEDQTIQIAHERKPAAPIAASMPSQNATMKPVVRKKRKGKSTGIAVALAALVAVGVLGAAGGGAYFYLNHSSDNSQAEPVLLGKAIVDEKVIAAQYVEEDIVEEDIVAEDAVVEDIVVEDIVAEDAVENDIVVEDTAVEDIVVEDIETEVIQSENYDSISPKEQSTDIESAVSLDYMEIRKLYIPIIEQYAEIMSTPSTDDFYNDSTAEFQVAYAFVDIDGNGIEECILKYDDYAVFTTENMTGDHLDATCIFTVENGEVIKVLGEMAQPQIGVTGCTRIFQGSNWIMIAYAHMGIPTTYLKYENGKITEELSFYVSSADNGYRFFVNDQEISEQEYNSRIESYANGWMGYDLILYDGTVKIEDNEQNNNAEMISNSSEIPIDITSSEGQMMDAFISKFDNYLGYILDYDIDFYYEDDATKTCMALFNYTWANDDRSVSNTASGVYPLIVEYFTSGNFTLSEDDGSPEPDDSKELFAVKDYQVIFKGGNFKDVYPEGQLREIKLVDSDYIVTYDILGKNIYTEEIEYSMGTYTIVLRYDGEKYQFHNISIS